MERGKTQDSKLEMQGFFAKAVVHSVASCFCYFAKAGGGGKAVRTFPCFFVHFFLAGIVTKQSRYERQYGTECAGVAHIAL